MTRAVMLGPDGERREVHHLGCYSGHLRIGIDWLTIGIARLCTYQCLLALEQTCQCRCLGRYHGRLGVPSIAVQESDLADWQEIGAYGYVAPGLYEELGVGPVPVVHCFDAESPRGCILTNTVPRIAA